MADGPLSKPVTASSRGYPQQSSFVESKTWFLTDSSEWCIGLQCRSLVPLPIEHPLGGTIPDSAHLAPVAWVTLPGPPTPIHTDPPTERRGRAMRQGVPRWPMHPHTTVVSGWGGLGDRKGAICTQRTVHAPVACHSSLRTQAQHCVAITLANCRVGHGATKVVTWIVAWTVWVRAALPAGSKDLGACLEGSRATGRHAPPLHKHWVRKLALMRAGPHYTSAQFQGRSY